jgi:hypothetical protein
MADFRLLICGSRTFRNRKQIGEYIREKRPTMIIAGGADGADTFAEDYAKSYKIDHQIYYAKWRVMGNFRQDAGYKRNLRMLEEGKPDLVAAFYDGEKTDGTVMMVRLAIEAGVDVEEYGL